MCAFAAVVGIIMCAHFSNRHHTLLFTLCLHTEAIVYHLHCGNYFINKTLRLFYPQGATHPNILFAQFFLLLLRFVVWFTIDGVRLRGTLSVKFFVHTQLIHRCTRISLTRTFFSSAFFLRILFTFFYRVFFLLFLIFFHWFNFSGCLSIFVFYFFKNNLLCSHRKRYR